LTPGSTPYVSSEAQLEKFYEWLADYFAFFANEVGGTFLTPHAFYESVQEAASSEIRTAAE
jgi:hypothetical protein